jgi:hypothetical protein
MTDSAKTSAQLLSFILPIPRSRPDGFALRVLVGLLVSLFCLQEARAGIIYDSLDPNPQPAVYIDPSIGYGPLADSFTTGMPAGVLTDVKVNLLFVGKINTSVSVDLTDNNTATTTPGAALFHIGDVDASPYNQQYVLVDFPNLSYSLLDNHRYWIQLSTPLHGPAWTYTSLYGVGVANEFTYYGRLGNSYSNNAPGAVVFEMQVSAGSVASVPEPSSLVNGSALLAIFGAVWTFRRFARRAQGA